VIRPLPLLILATAGVTVTLAVAAPGVSQPEFAGLSAEYKGTVRPLLLRYCTGCHSTAKRAGELDLQRFKTLPDVRKGTKSWLHVPDMLHNGEMPPKGAKQPTHTERKLLADWAQRYLDAEALASAGDPGPVGLRRLNNAEYTYTVRDLTGLDRLEPAKEFPADGAAGEGFTNAANALAMSPALLAKYFDAGKEIAAHAELLPDGVRFSPSTTRSDWTNEALARIRALYARYSDSGGGSAVNLQGIRFDTNDGGRLPVRRYLEATLVERDAIRSGAKTLAAVAAERNLSPKYLTLLWTALNRENPSPLLASLQQHWRSSKPDGAACLAAWVGSWQSRLWRFMTVGQIGRSGGPKAWQEEEDPAIQAQEIRLKLAPTADGKDSTVYLVTGDAGDGGQDDTAHWRQPRLVTPGRSDVLLCDLRAFTAAMRVRRERLAQNTAAALAAADDATRATGDIDVAALAKKHEVDEESLGSWLEYLGIGTYAAPALNRFGTKLVNQAGYDFVKGWGSPDLPSLVANSSDRHVRIPGNMKPHGVCVHPTPTLSACVGWQSTVTGPVRIEGKVAHAHPECGNGVTWSLELRRGAGRQRLASGTAQGGNAGVFGPLESVLVRPGDLVSLVIGPRNGDHSCDLTDLELSLKSTGTDPKEWSLTRDVSPDVLAGNPHADRYGTPDVWHFYSERVAGVEAAPVAPTGSLLARWHASGDAQERHQIALGLQRLLIAGPGGQVPANAALYGLLHPLNSALYARAWRELYKTQTVPPDTETAGIDHGPDSKPKLLFIQGDLVVSAPTTVRVRVPADLASGSEIVSTATLSQNGGDGSIQVLASLTPSANIESGPLILGAKARERYRKAFADFRALFPAALCYTKIVPVDEVVTLILFYREDEPLKRLMLSDPEVGELDRLWSELRWTSQQPLKQVNALEQLIQFATQDRQDLVPQFQALVKPTQDAADAFERELVASEPKQLEALLAFAGRAYRRPLTNAEGTELRSLYQKLRSEEIPHEEAFRLTLARVFTSPSFLYRLEASPRGPKPAPVTDWELANRLSYFLWSSQPDDALRAAAAKGTLRKPAVLAEQTHRMLKSPKIRRLATEFAAQWLHIYEFDALDEKSEKLFPEFAGLRGDMYEESLRFFTDLFQRDLSVMSAFDADHTFVNGRLAKFYAFPGANKMPEDEWRRIDGVRSLGRGGLLAFATTLAKQSGASRTSPILRGNWVSEVLLGERLPRPPKDVPKLPEDETATEGLTVRQLVAKHTSDPRCYGCHKRIDPFGFSLEGFDAIGRLRTKDLADRPIDVKTVAPDGQALDGLNGLRTYLTRTRRDTVLRVFCKKLLGYALGRETQLSDEPLLAEMQARMKKNGYRFSVAVDAIVQSAQFGNKRPGDG
jgi:hypothetical protein